MPPPKNFPRIEEIIGLRRFQALLPIMACLGLWVLAINFSLLWLLGPAPNVYALNEEYIDWKNFEHAADTILAVEAEYRAGAEAQQKSFVLYTGLSSAIEGVDPGVLRTNGCDSPIVAVCATGNGMQQLIALMAPVLRSKLVPSLAILCLHPAFLAGAIEDLPPSSLNPLDGLRKRDWHTMVRQVSWWNWLAKNRFYVNQVAFRFLYEVRVYIGTGGDVDPYNTPARLGYPEHTPEEGIRPKLAGAERGGWFDRKHYAREQQAQAEDLRATISRFRDRGTDVLVVIMPEGSFYRSHVPSEAKQFLNEYLSREFRTPLVRVLDFENAIPDSGFTDQIHMNSAGRAAFSLQLAQAIRNCRN